MPEKINILGIKVDNVTFDEAKSLVLNMCREEGLHRVYTPNSEIIMEANKDRRLREIINSGSLVTPDGIGVIHASKILGTPLKERVAGFDLLNGLLEDIAKQGLKLYLLGGKPGIADKAKANIEARFPNIQIVGTQDGYFRSSDLKRIVDDINGKGTDILSVCLGSPKQEHFVYQNRDKIKVKVALGGGGSLDVFAGEVKRAPQIFINLGLEWLYRISSDPRRLGRALDLPRFAIAVLAHKFKKG